MNGHQYEWACQWKTFLDGEYDRMISHHPLSRQPLTESEAQEEVANMLAARIPARLILREVSAWQPAGKRMSEDEGMNITDHEYTLIRNHLPPSMAAFFDGLKASGSRLGDSIDGSKLPYIRAWHRAIDKAQADGLTRRPRIHDLRSEFRRRQSGDA